MPPDAKLKSLLQCALTKMYFIFVLAVLEYVVYFFSNNISEASEKGVYYFVGFQLAGNPEWIQKAGTIRIN